MKRKKEIVISPTRLVAGLIVFLVLVASGFIFVPRLSKVFEQKSIGMTAEVAARAGAEAFLSVDAKAGKDAWIDKVCSTSTPTGCKMIGKVYAPMLWPSIEKKGLRFSCKASSASKLQTIEADPGAEIWELKTICTNLNTGEMNQSATQVIVTETTDVGWKFERIQFDQETQK